MSSALFQLDDDEDDALFASVPMPDFHNDNPVATGALSYGAGDQEASTVPKQPLYQHQQQQFERQSYRSLEVSNETSVTPVAQSTQLLTRQQQQQPSSSSRGKSTHRRSAGKFPGPAGRLPRLRVDPSRGSANPFAAAARQLVASAAAAASSRREERATAATAATAGSTKAGAGAGLIIASSSQTSTVSNSSSQSGLEDEASWSAAAADLGPGLCRYLSRYSIAEAVRLVAAGSLPRNKVPAMLVMIETVDPSAVDCVATVKDSTGRLQATLHRQLFRDLRDRVQSGSSLVLRRVTLFSADQRSYYLNITMDNIVRVYDRSGSPLATSACPANSANSNALLSDDEVRQLEAECMRPRTPPTVQAQQQAASSHRRWSSVDQTPTGAGVSRPQPPKRFSDSRFCDVSGAGSSTASPYTAAAAAASPSSFSSNDTPVGAKRFRFTPISHPNRPQTEQQQQQRCHSHPQQSRQQQQQSRPDTRVLQESYRDAFDDNMDEILASALDDI